MSWLTLSLSWRDMQWEFTPGPARTCVWVVMRHAEPCRTWLSVRLPQDHLLQRLGSTGLLCVHTDTHTHINMFQLPKGVTTRAVIWKRQDWLTGNSVLCILKYEIFIWPAAAKLHIAFRIKNALIYLFTTLGSTLLTLLSHCFYVTLWHHLWC